MNSALDGIKVIEYGGPISVPYCGKMLADLGAEVIKIEKPGTGDSSRRMGPFPDDEVDTEHSGFFLYLNTNKYGVTLDIEKPDGRKIFKELIKGANVFIEGTKSRQLAETGLDYPDLKKVNPSLVMTSITPFGQTGPYKNYNGSDLTAWHMGGVGILTPRLVGTEKQEPLRVLHIASFISGMTAAAATMCAIRVQEHNGTGQRVDVSEFEAIATATRIYLAFWAYEHRNVTRVTPTQYAPQNFIKCKDGWIFIQGVEEHHWKRIVECMGNPEWANEEAFKDRYNRAHNWYKLEPLLTKWAMSHTKAEIAEMGNSKGIPMGPVHSMEEVLGNDHLKARDFFKVVESASAGKILQPGAPYNFTKTPWAIRKPAPTPGQDNKEIFCTRLGHSTEELVSLHMNGVV